MATLSSYRSGIELEYTNGDYTNLCNENTLTNTTILSGITAQGGSIANCDSDTTSYRIIASLPSVNAQTTPATAYAAGEDAFCINSLGTATLGMYEDFDSLTAPACTSGEVGGGAFPQYCVMCEACEERDTQTGETINWIGWEPQPECSGAPACSWDTSGCR
jgi:hypothetical protein